MPSVKMPRHGTDTDMTPFVDIAFLILTFFIMATKFKPAEPVEINKPSSVSSVELPEDDALLITIDSINRVYFSVLATKDKSISGDVIKKINTGRNLSLSATQIDNFKRTNAVGVSFSQLPALLELDAEEQGGIKQNGIPVLDSANNELIWWISATKEVYAERRRELKYLIKGDGQSKYPTFEAVITALKKNDQFKYNLVTDLENAPTGSALDIAERKGTKIH